MSPAEYGHATNQHEQRTQQAALFLVPARPTRIDAHVGCMHPPCDDWLRETIEMAFVHHERIEIDSWSCAEETEPELSAADRAFEYQMAAADYAVEDL